MKLIELRKMKDVSYILRALSEDQMNELSKFLKEQDSNFFIDPIVNENDLSFIKQKAELIIGGDTSTDLSKENLVKFIPLRSRFFRKGIIKGFLEEIVEYKCYASNKDINIYNNIQLHEDRRSSFKCALSSIGNPKFALITLERYE